MEHFPHLMYFAAVCLPIQFTEPTQALKKTSLWGWAKELDQYPLQVNSLGLCAIKALRLKPSADPVPTMLVGDSWKHKCLRDTDNRAGKAEV